MNQLLTDGNHPGWVFLARWSWWWAAPPPPLLEEKSGAPPFCPCHILQGCYWEDPICSLFDCEGNWSEQRLYNGWWRQQTRHLLRNCNLSRYLKRASNMTKSPPTQHTNGFPPTLLPSAGLPDHTGPSPQAIHNSAPLQNVPWTWHQRKSLFSALIS